MGKRIIPQIEELSLESQKLFDALNNESDLSVILLGGSFLDASLSSILERKLIKSSVSKKMLDSRWGALGSFATRADACYVLRLINKVLHDDLLKIAEIRNEIAHYHLALGFDSETVTEKCASLSYVKSLNLGLDRYMGGARNQFVLSVVMISQRLLLIGLRIKRDS